ILSSLTGATEWGPRRLMGRMRSGEILVAAQVAIALTLAVGASLFVRTLWNLESQDIGFDQGRILTFWLAPGEAGKQTDMLAPYFEAAADRLSAMAGVEAAGESSDGVLSGFVGSRPVTVAGQTPGATDMTAQWNLVGPRFFDAIGMRIVRGRDFTKADDA